MIQSTLVPPGGHRPIERDEPGGPYPMGLMVILATVTMLFSAFTAALLMRRAAADWAPIQLPAVLWLNTTLLLVSSVLVEGARAAIRADRQLKASRFLAAGGVLGLLFVAGQAAAWQMLALQGVFLRTGPYSAFFYVLSVLHALHIVAGLAALGWTLRRLRLGAYGPGRDTGFSHAAIFWHFLGATWVYLFAVLLVF